MTCHPAASRNEQRHKHDEVAHLRERVTEEVADGASDGGRDEVHTRRRHFGRPGQERDQLVPTVDALKLGVEGEGERVHRPGEDSRRRLKVEGVTRPSVPSDEPGLAGETEVPRERMGQGAWLIRAGVHDLLPRLARAPEGLVFRGVVVPGSDLSNLCKGEGRDGVPVPAPKASFPVRRRRCGTGGQTGERAGDQREERAPRGRRSRATFPNPEPHGEGRRAPRTGVEGRLLGNEAPSAGGGTGEGTEARQARERMKTRTLMRCAWRGREASCRPSD